MKKKFVFILLFAFIVNFSFGQERIGKNALPFEEDLCGTWVSDYVWKEYYTPYVVIKIQKTENNHTAALLPYCTLLELYQSIANVYPSVVTSFNSSPVNSYAENVVQQEGKATFSFGHEIFKERIQKNSSK